MKVSNWCITNKKIKWKIHTFIYQVVETNLTFIVILICMLYIVKFVVFLAFFKNYMIIYHLKIKKGYAIFFSLSKRSTKY